MKEKNVHRGESSSLPVFQENTGKFIYEKLLEHRSTKEVVLVNEQTGKQLTCEELLQNSSKLAHTFSFYNLEHNKTIALCSENNINYITIVLGALYTGVPIVFINPNYTEFELQHSLDVTKPDLIFCSALHLNKFIKLKFTNRFIKKIITIDSNNKNTHSIGLQEFINERLDKSVTHLNPKIRNVDINNHIAFILFSSGTTGLPKGVTLTHLSLNATLAYFLSPEMFSENDSDISVAILPLFHIYGLYTVIMTLCRNRKVIILEKFTPETYLKAIEKYKITMLITVPPLVQFFLKSPIVDKYDLSSVTEIACGAAPLGKDIAAAIKKKLNLKLVRNGYGMTESGLGIAVPPRDVEISPGSVGRLIAGISCVIRDISTGENLSPYQKGEICIKGPTVTKGYYRNEEATKSSFTEDGWFKTGDIGYFDENGLLYIVDRMKELIKYKGFQVAPAELEQILVTHPEIEDAGVIGIADNDAGELPLAFVVKRPNSDLTELQVQQYVAKFVSHQKHLHGGVVFIDAIPRNPSGKIIRRDLKELRTTKKSKL